MNSIQTKYHYNDVIYDTYKESSAAVLKNNTKNINDSDKINYSKCTYYSKIYNECNHLNGDGCCHEFYVDDCKLNVNNFNNQEYDSLNNPRLAIIPKKDKLVIQVHATLFNKDNTYNKFDFPLPTVKIYERTIDLPNNIMALTLSGF